MERRRLLLIWLFGAALAVSIACPACGQGSIVGWGANWSGQCDVPSPNNGFVAIAAGGLHSMGLKSGGSIVAWGHNEFGQCDVPPPNSGFVAVAAGWHHSLGLKYNGSIVAWGHNEFGQCDVPSPNSGFVAVAAGWHHSLGLKYNGSIVAWGNNVSGQCDVPSPNKGFVAIAAGGYHSLGLKSDGSIVAWGHNEFGECDVPSPNRGFVAIAAGLVHSLGLKFDGSIVAWGNNGYGQCDVPSPNTGFVAIAAGGHYSLGLRADGSIVAWGRNDSGQCNVPFPNTGFVAVAAGPFHGLGLIWEQGAVYDIFSAKRAPDEAFAHLTGPICTAVFGNVLYVETPSRTCGIRVETTGHNISVGQRVTVLGTVQTNLDGERYIAASSVQPITSVPVEELAPLGLRNDSLGGSALHLQQGVDGGFGLNNIGLLIRTWGRVTQVGEGYIYIDDGSHLKDGTLTGSEENVGVRVICDPSGYAIGDYVAVTGISSCFKTQSDTVARKVIAVDVSAQTIQGL